MGSSVDSSAQNGIGTRVKSARERRGWNREALAFHSGISWSAIAQVEAGRRTNVRPATLHSLADALGVTIDYLVAGGRAAPPMLFHQALLYSSDAEFLDTAVPFLAEAVDRDEPALAVTTEANVELLRDRLGRAAQGIEFARRTAWYRTPSTALAGYVAFLERKLEGGAAWVRILGEPPRANGSKPDLSAWTRYEAVLNLAFGAEPVSVLCPYDKRGCDKQIIGQARVTHPHLAEPHTLACNPDFADPAALLLES
jgi:transcriptional regulator with XRE-family HTH domain